MLVNLIPGVSTTLEAEKRTEQRKYVDSTGIFGRPVKKLKMVAEFIPIKRSVTRSDQRVFINPDNISDMTYDTIDPYAWWNKVHFEKGLEPPGIRNAIFVWGRDTKIEEMWSLQLAMNNSTEFEFFYHDKYTLDGYLDLIKTKIIY